MPCFEDPAALAGYTEFHLLSRPAKLADALRVSMPQPPPEHPRAPLDVHFGGQLPHTRTSEDSC